VSAFEVAGTAVAVANAVDPALDAASVVTGHHHEDGVAEYLEEWLATH
jgi:hydroxymethylpyrimidine pyrophosphatase-like HAD family hydrolase